MYPRLLCVMALVVSLLQIPTAAPRGLTEREMVEAIALGRQCKAPIVRVVAPNSEFAAYIESPSARAALVAAAATMMQQPLDAAHVRRAMLPGYRVWAQRVDDGWQSLTIHSITARHAGRTIEPTTVQTTRFFMGTVPSHGIVPDLRMRSPEFTFSDLPDTAFEIDVETSRGHRRLGIGREQSLMRVCN